MSAMSSGRPVRLSAAQSPILSNHPALLTMSVRVGPGVEAVLCKDNDFNGGCIVVTQDNGFINTKTVGNDQTSSVKVQHAGAGQ